MGDVAMSYHDKKNYINLVLLSMLSGPCEHGDEPSGSIKCGEFLD
jgi:hypothetical protein